MDAFTSVPRLIESQTGHYLYQTLQKCHEYRVKVYSQWFNIAILVVFIVVTFLILFFLKKKKKTPEEKERQAIMDQQYILEKIRALQHQRDVHLASQSITNMPMSFKSPYDPVSSS